MSRVDIKGEKFDLAFGVDHVTGAFVQLWVKPAIEQDASIAKIDSFGVKIEAEGLNGVLPKAVLDYLKHQEDRFKAYRAMGKPGRPNIDEQVVIDLACVVGGFPDISQQVYRVFGEDL